MHLVYVYVENFENRVKNKEYNLSSKYTIHFKKETKYLEVKENEEYIDNFWPDNIYDIKAIVGENGCGKSTVLDIIFSNSFEHRSLPYWDIPIFIFEGENGLVVHKRSGFEMKIASIITEPTIDFSENHFKYNDIINSTTNIVYYSNLWDQIDSYLHNDDIFNISTSTVISSSNQELFNGNFKDAKGLYSYRTLEFQRQIDYVINNADSISSYIPQLPEYISIKLIDGQKQEAEFVIGDDDKFEAIIKPYFEVLKTLRVNADLIDTSRVGFFTSLALAYDANGTTQYKTSETSPIWILLTKLLAENSEIENIVNEVQKLDKSSVDVGYTVTQSIELYAEFENELRNVSAEQNITSFAIKIDDSIKAVYNKYLRSIPLMPYLEFNWREMSSGEKGLLALLSRFEYLKKLPDYKKSNPAEEGQAKKDMIIIMDEVELYFHPNWQRKLVKILTNEIAPMFNGAKIQFIIASHSPFLISDLPRNNVIYLTNQEEGLATVVAPTGLDHTFGANIHELLANPFFMKSTLGDFSKEVISDLIKYTKGEKQERIKEDAIAQRFIDIIGEPVIKNKIQDMLNKRRHKTELIKFYKEQIIKLEKD